MITITTYRELSEFVGAFAVGHLNMLIVCSRGGLGKSEEARRALPGNDVVFVGGHVTPLALYELLYEGRDKPVVFDEIDGLLGDTRHVGLLKQLCETRELKRIQWVSKDKRAEEIDGGAGHFLTRSPVLILCNSFVALNANVAALQTRATVVQFVPSLAEILAKIRTFGTDAQIIEFVQQHHECLADFTLRTYGQLAELKAAGLDWQRYALAGNNVPPKVIEIADLLTRFSRDVERVEHYSGSRRDFYSWKPAAEAYLCRQMALELRAGYPAPV